MEVDGEMLPVLVPIDDMGPEYYLDVESGPLRM